MNAHMCSEYKKKQKPIKSEQTWHYTQDKKSQNVRNHLNMHIYYIGWLHSVKVN